MRFALLMLSVAGCALPVIPRELVDARAAYEHAAAGRAWELVPAELHKAGEALILAQEAWAGDPQSRWAEDLAYVALRSVQRTEVLANIEAELHGKLALTDRRDRRAK